jgi:DNA-binding NarL/FixJ family response regulator
MREHDGYPVRVLIADDHPLFREGIRGRLDRVADVAVVEEAESGDDAVQMAKEFEPDVIHMDIKIEDFYLSSGPHGQESPARERPYRYALGARPRPFGSGAQGYRLSEQRRQR